MKHHYGQRNDAIKTRSVSQLLVVTNLDRNMKGDVNAVLATFIDWKSAYSRQCHTLGIKSFINNGVRPSLIPVLISYFQNRRMQVKFHGTMSESKHQPGSGAQGASLGNWEFLSQTNNNADCVPEEDRYKYVDDLSILEIINLLNIGLSSHNFKDQVADDIPIHGQIIDNNNLLTQQYLNEINEWTINQKMLLNEKKTKSMIINFSHNYQFSTRLLLNNKNVEIVDQIKILGTIFTSNLKWDKNCEQIITKVNRKMLLLKKILKFGATREEMVHLWISYCRSVLEQSAVLWAGSLTQENKEDLERTQKSFAKLVLNKDYNEDQENSYQNALMKLNIQTLEQRRKELCLQFAKDSIKSGMLKDLLKENTVKNGMNMRNSEKYEVLMANRERTRESSIIYMQNLLNEDHKNTKNEVKISR